MAITSPLSKLESIKDGVVCDDNAKPDENTVAPSHIAVIMDGNGRWAKNRFLPRSLGHKAGFDALRRLVEAVPNYGIKTLTVYAFSTENWRRPSDEIEGLFSLLKQFVKSDLAKLKKQGVKIVIMGRRDGLADDIKDIIDLVHHETEDNNRLTLVICLNYGGQAEIIDATKRIAHDVKSGIIAENEVCEDLFRKYIYVADIPDPDIIIRTAGEKRLSNFLLWQGAYSELIFMDVL